MGGTVVVSGAELYVERAGEGPPLLLISGGGGDAGMYAEVVPLLAARFTVLTYDRRGNSRSRFTHPAASIEVAVQAADAIAILDHFGIDRAYLFGSSGGAIIGLDVVTRNTDRLLGAVIHEPPLVQILPPDSAERREIAEIGRLAREKSPLRAYAAFGAMTLPDPPWLFRSPAGQALIAGASRLTLRLSPAVRKLTGREPGSMTRQLGNADLLLRRELPSFCFDYQPDADVLHGAQIPWCLATGSDSRGKPYYTPAHVLAAQLGVPCEEFPGGHTSYLQQPQEFTEALTKTLDGFGA